jgi:FMN phosphatase YigB (HAD superfamily)
MFEGILTLSEISLLEEIYWNSFIQYADISKDVVNRLYESKQNGDIYVLCTNQNAQIQLNKISSWGLDLFDFVITSEEIGYEKPNKLFFNYVEKKLQKIDLSSFKVYALGDDLENDIKYWKENYGASSFLIDNSIESFENINGIIYTNITKAVHDITN